MHVWEALMAAGEEFGIAPFGVEAQRVLRLEKAHIIVGQDTDALSDPFSANMEWAVKMNKRDFLGKPMLTRISERGIGQRLVGFRMARRDVVPEEGLQAVRPDGNGKQEIIGWLTSCRFSPALNETIGLCWLPAHVAAEAGTPFQIRRDGELEGAYVHHGPFYDPEGERLQM
jgi:sarcosine oxidase subunit alpha